MLPISPKVAAASLSEWGRKAAAAVNGLIASLGDYLPLTGGALTDDLIVPDEAYGVGWNGSLEVPTKNALYDKIETISAGGVSDGDKGDITVSGTGAVWTIDSGAVSLAKQADVATATVFYRKTAGAGAPEVQALSTLKTDLGLTGTNSGDQTITLTGDATGTGTGSFATTLATVNANVGSFGTTTAIPVITVNAKGLITAVTTATPTGRQWALVGAGQTAAGVWDFAVDGAKANVDFTGLAGYSDILLIAQNVTKATTGTLLGFVSVDNGSTWFTTSGDYAIIADTGIGTNTTAFAFHGTNATAGRSGMVQIHGTNVATGARLIEQKNNSAAHRLFLASSLAINAVRINGSGGGNLTGGKIYCFAR